MVPGTSALTYRAFISYSHADARWAKWPHRRLEAFRIGPDLAGRETAMGRVPNALAPVFRDREEFAAGHSLSDQTRAALDDSMSLIVICSPIAAKSQYVNDFALAHHGAMDGHCMRGHIFDVQADHMAAAQFAVDF
jgi:MTH538 TIR-like domain (DUF1863)